MKLEEDEEGQSFPIQTIPFSKVSATGIFQILTTYLMYFSSNTV